MKPTNGFGFWAAAVLGLAMTAPAMASCPSGLTAEQHITCINVEGDGFNYQEYVAERAAEIAAARTGGLKDESARGAREDTDTRAANDSSSALN